MSPRVWLASGGGDITWKMTPQMVGAFTANTDFAETEVDARREEPHQLAMIAMRGADHEHGALRRSGHPTFALHFAIDPSHALPRP